MAYIPTAKDLAALIAAVIIIHAAGRLLYNLFLHPLRGYPGPPSWAASPVPKALHVLMGTYGRKTVEFHGIYGPAVRVAPGELAFIGAQARLDIFVRPLKDELVKDIRFLGVNIHDGYGIVTASQDVHPRMRRLFVHALSSASIQTQSELVVARHVNTMINKMNDVCRGDSVLDMLDLLNFIVYDAISELTFGETLKLLETGENIPWMRIMVGARKFIVFRAIFLDIPVIGRLLETLMAGPMKGRMREHCRLSEDIVNRRLSRGKGGKPDLWGYVMKHSGSPKGLTMGEMYANGAMFPLAGESSGVVMTGTLYYVLTNPAVYVKLTREIRSAFSTCADISVDAVSRLAYLNAVIQEGMRVYPPGAVGIARFASPGGTEISGKVVPEGTLVTWNVYAAATSPTHFHRPREFLPERWLKPRDPEFEADCREAHEPFSRGSRSCIGKRFAMLEMRMVLANVFWHFDLELCDGMEGWLDQKSYLTWEKGPLMVKVSKVNRSRVPCLEG